MRDLLLQAFHSALAENDPYLLTLNHLPERPSKGQVAVLAVGKAALPMLKAAEDTYGPDLIGHAVTRYGHGGATLHIPLDEASHPTPDDNSERAAQKALHLAASLEEKDTLIILISGGGSALWCAPRGITRPEKTLLTRLLLNSGATIHEINTVRKQFSHIKGGQLAEHTRAKVVTLMLSDVSGDDPSIIASGPTIPDSSTPEDALEVLQRYGLDQQPELQNAVQHLRHAPPRKNARKDRTSSTIIGSNFHFLKSVQHFWQQQGIPAILLGDTFTGEARELAAFHAGVVRSIRNHAEPVKPPVVLISGGEASVTVKGSGQGGRNQEFLLWLCWHLKDEGVWAFAADTDGIDGTTHAAGALLTPDTFQRAQAVRNIKKDLEDNNAFAFFEALEQLVVTGPTHNNLNDCRMVYVSGTR
ncbi:glycerate kinase type-2 family protein [Deinococcus cellulosilyticus]|uniref:Glycerate dehydrogenase n=1 Tax=Deinococcus cellulosilyticus (strain DSM 18568 / NBRC 106333 / KACC 11606 / 5516J-15) TaxID=1223518 RepID=A0A511N305_DEIC1|nr:glycerate kinase [Deinococcus cellulosilyticus]GEM46791.1 glycerate dehydrogenase [Deinococcus cellulosilyticus NBRC 106333 = KACC 11606]